MLLNPKKGPHLEILLVNYLFRLSGLSFVLLCLLVIGAAAQTPTPTATPTPDPFVVQITSAVPNPSPALPEVNAFVGDANGDGRFVVFESRADLATIAPGQTARTPGNADGNREI